MCHKESLPTPRLLPAERAWTALRARSVESRFEALHATGLTALVGREEETELLAAALGDRWS